MEREKAQLLELVRCGLWGKELDIKVFEGEVDWQMLIKLANQQTILGIIFPSIERLPKPLRPKREIIIYIHRLITINRQNRNTHIRTLGAVIELVKRAGVEKPVLLKGLGMGLNYPDPSLRQCGDLDIYVGEEHYFELWDFISRELNIPKGKECSDQHFDFMYMNTHIEIHRYATSPRCVAYAREEFVEWCQTMLEGDKLRRVTIADEEIVARESREGEIEVLLPPLDFDYIYIFYHTWKHFLTGGVGLRQFCDWACHVDKFAGDFDREELERLIAKFKLEIPISIFATIATEQLGLEACRFPRYVACDKKVADRALDKIWSGGNFGLYRKEKAGKSRTMIGRKFGTLRSMINDMRFMVGVDMKYALRFYSQIFLRSFKSTLKNREQLTRKL